MVSPLDPFIPLIIAIVKQSGFPSRWNALIALGVYVIWTLVSLGTGLVSAGQPITLDLVLSRLSIDFAVGYAAYASVWKQLGEPQLEAKTSLYKGVQEDPIVSDTPSGNPSAAG